MSPPASVGASKSGALTKLRAPVPLSIWKRAASAPPLMRQLSVPTLSPSVAVAVVTAVVFSLTLRLALAPPPSLVMTGAWSLPSVMVTVRAWVSVCTPSRTSTITS